MIGVTPLYDDQRQSIWMLPSYLQAIQVAGGIPVMLPFAEQVEDITAIVDLLDGLLLTGGQDVDPLLFNEEKIGLCEVPNKAKDSLELGLINEMCRRDKPIFGICRGMQILNVHLGGTLYQDLQTQCKSDINHEQKLPYDVPSHGIKIMKHTVLYDILKKTEIFVNSYHHQAIKSIATGLSVLAKSDDGVIEAVSMPDKRFVLAVQWHPEFMYQMDQDQMLLFQSFVDHCK